MFSSKENLAGDLLGKETLLRLLEMNDPDTTVAVFDTYPIYPRDVQRLVDIINSNTHLRALKLLDCHLLVDGVKQIAEAALENTTLEEIKIETFGNDDESLKRLIESVHIHLEENATRGSRR